METTRPLILITNDDSIHAPGITHLARIAARLGDVFVVAPADPRSGQAAAITVGAPLRINEKVSDVEGARFFTVNGTPVDCIKLALHDIVPRRPDFVFSGINHGSNSAVNVIYSGTMGAVIEGCIQGIPSVGFSLLHHSMKADFDLSAPLVSEIAAKIVAKGLPEGVCLNINIPARVVPEGFKICRAARGRWTDEYKRYLDPNGIPFYWLIGRFVNEEPEAEDTDEYWLQRRHITIVPVSPDMTATDALKTISQIFD